MNFGKGRLGSHFQGSLSHNLVKPKYLTVFLRSAFQIHALKPNVIVHTHRQGGNGLELDKDRLAFSSVVIVSRKNYYKSIRVFFVSFEKWFEIYLTLRITRAIHVFEEVLPQKFLWPGIAVTVFPFSNKLKVAKLHQIFLFNLCFVDLRFLFFATSI